MSSADTPTTDDVEETEAPPTDDLRDDVVGRLGELLGDGVVASEVAPGLDMWVRVAPDSWARAGEVLRDVLGARYFCFLSAIDWEPSPFGRYLDAEVDTVLAETVLAETVLAEAEAEPADAEPDEPAPREPGITGGDTRFQILARVANPAEGWGITLKADAGPDDEPRIETWTGVYAGADWHEREAWEMFGITFDGHPFLRHIYLPGDFEGNPLRKDFPLIARMVKPWPGIVDVEPLPEVEEPEPDPSTESAGSTEGGSKP